MDGEGIRMMAKHLARVKLEAAEQSYALKQQIRHDQEEQKEVLAALEACKRKLSESEAAIMMMKKEGSRKYCIEERNDWKALVAALNKDRSRVQKENEQLAAERSHAVEAKMRACRRSDQLQEELKNFRQVHEMTSEDDTLGQQQNPLTISSKGGAPLTDTDSELQLLRQECRSLKAAAMRERRQGEERRVQWALETQTQKAELRQLQIDNQGLRGQLLQRPSNRGGFLSDLSTAFRFCSQPPKRRHVVEA